MTFIRKAGTSQPETLVSEKTEYTLAIHLPKTKSKLFGVSFFFNKQKESFGKNFLYHWSAEML